MSNKYGTTIGSEISEERDETQRQRERIREIVEYQKSIYSCSSSNSCSVPCSGRKSTSLFGLMRSGSTSLRRLFDMEHTSLATYFKDYSGSPMIKPIFLWGSDSENENRDGWEYVKQFKPLGIREDHSSSKPGFDYGEFRFLSSKISSGTHKLSRKKKSFRRLPRFGFWICRGFRLRFRLRLRIKLRVVCCRRK